jgi:hypothetical protein
MADKDRATPSPEIGVASAVNDGDAEIFALGDGLAPACGEQAASKKAPINSKRARTTHI